MIYPSIFDNVPVFLPELGNSTSIVALDHTAISFGPFVCSKPDRTSDPIVLWDYDFEHLLDDEYAYQVEQYRNKQRCIQSQDRVRMIATFAAAGAAASRRRQILRHNIRR